MPPTSIDSVRSWFLALPQMQKTLVFGGLGMLSGWVTTGLIQAAMTFKGQNQDPFAVALVRYVIAPTVPGMMLCLLVTLPNLYLERGTSDGWPRTLLIMILLHPAAFLMFLLLSGTYRAGRSTFWSADRTRAMLRGRRRRRHFRLVPDSLLHVA